MIDVFTWSKNASVSDTGLWFYRPKGRLLKTGNFQLEVRKNVQQVTDRGTNEGGSESGGEWWEVSSLCFVQLSLTCTFQQELFPVINKLEQYSTVIRHMVSRATAARTVSPFHYTLTTAHTASKWLNLSEEGDANRADFLGPLKLKWVGSWKALMTVPPQKPSP